MSDNDFEFLFWIALTLYCIYVLFASWLVIGLERKVSHLQALLRKKDEAYMKLLISFGDHVKDTPKRDPKTGRYLKRKAK